MTSLDHFDSCSRHGSLVREWKNETTTSTNPEEGLSSSSNNNFENTNEPSDPALKKEDSSISTSTTNPSSPIATTTTNNSQQLLPLHHNHYNNLFALQEKILSLSHIPVQIVGLLLFNPTISIDDDTSDANILFSERRAVWGTAGQNTNSSQHPAHCVPNHAGLCSGFKGLASIFCKPSFNNNDSSTKSTSTKTNADAPPLSQHPSQNLVALPGVRFVAQVKGIHVFVTVEPNFFLVITVERPTNLVSSDSLIVDEMTQSCQTLLDAIRVLHGSFHKMWNACLENQRSIVKQVIEEQMLQNPHGKVPSTKKIESKARVSAAKDVCAKVAPLCHNLYNFLDEKIKTLFAGPCMLTSVANILKNNNNNQNTRGIQNSSFHNSPQAGLKRVGSSNSIGSGGKIPDFSSQNNNNNNSTTLLASSSSSSPPTTKINNNNNNNNAPLHINTLTQPSNQFQGALPLFGPLSLAATPLNLRMSASILCSRMLDAHLSLLKNVIILDSASILSPLSLTTVAPTVVATSVPPSVISSLLGAVLLYKPPSNNSHTNNLNGDHSAANSNSNAPTQTKTEAQILSGIKIGACKFLRLVKLKGDGSHEVSTNVDGNSKTEEERAAENSNNNNNNSSELISLTPSCWGTCRGVRRESTSTVIVVSQKKKNGNSTDDENDLANDSTDAKNYERNELWLFQLGPHLVVCCEAKSSLLSVPGSRISLIHEICQFLSGIVQVKTPSRIHHNNNSNDDESILEKDEESQADKRNQDNIQDLLRCAESFFARSSSSSILDNNNLLSSLSKNGNGRNSRSGSPTSGSSGENKNSSNNLNSPESFVGAGAIFIKKRLLGERGSDGGGALSATVDDFPHFLENSSLRIGTVNTNSKWFPPLASELKAAATNITNFATANGGGMNVNNFTKTTTANNNTVSSTSRGASPEFNNSSNHNSPSSPAANNANNNNSPLTYLNAATVATNGAFFASASTPQIQNNSNQRSESSSSSQQQQQHRQILLARQAIVALQLSTLKPKDDDLNFGPPAFILKNMLHSQVENTALRSEGLAIAHQRLSESSCTPKERKIRRQQAKNNNNYKSPILLSSMATTTVMMPSSPPPSSLKNTSRSDNGSTNNTKKQVRVIVAEDDQQNDQMLAADSTCDGAAYVSYLDCSPFSLEDQQWFTRGTSTFGNSILSLVTDRQAPTSNQATENVKGGKTKTVLNLLRDESYEDPLFLEQALMAENEKAKNAAAMTTTTTATTTTNSSNSSFHNTAAANQQENGDNYNSPQKQQQPPTAITSTTSTDDGQNDQQQFTIQPVASPISTATDTFNYLPPPSSSPPTNNLSSRTKMLMRHAHTGGVVGSGQNGTMFLIGNGAGGNQSSSNSNYNNNNNHNDNNSNDHTNNNNESAPGLMSALLDQRQERWAFASADGDRVAGIIDNMALNGEEAAETGRRALRLFGMHNAVNL